MLDKTIFVKGLNKLLITYPNWNFDTDSKETLRVWYEFFNRMDNDRYLHMIDEHIKKENFNPTVASLKSYDTLPRKSATQIQHEKEMAEYEKKLKEEQQNART